MAHIDAAEWKDRWGAAMHAGLEQDRAQLLDAPAAPRLAGAGGPLGAGTR